MASLAGFVGRGHPVILHFPIALLWIAAFVEAIRVRQDSLFLSRAVIWLTAIGAVSGIAATGSGWLLAVHEPVRFDQRDTLEWHRWFGLATAVMAVLAWAAAVRWAEGATPALRRLRHGLIWGVAATLAGAAHLGATLVWGSDWFQFSTTQ